MLSLAYVAERQVRHRRRPVDYDDSLVPGEIVQSILHLGHVTARSEEELGLALRWTYGSAFGTAHGWLRHRMKEPWATLAFGSVLLSATFTLFPLLGRTPPPWRWPRGYVASELFTHAAYAATVGAADARLSA